MNSSSNKIAEIEEIKDKESSPDERGNVSIQGNVKIFDPKTKEIFVNVRT